MEVIAAFIAAYAIRKSLQPPKRRRPAWHYLVFLVEIVLIIRFLF